MNLRADGDGGLYSTVPHRAVRMAQRSEAVSEEMRILYVALTRARDKLIVTAPLQNPEKTLSALATTLAGTGGAEPYTLSQALSFSEWLCTAALLHPDCEELRKYAGGALLPVYAARGHMRARVVPAQPPGRRRMSRLPLCAQPGRTQRCWNSFCRISAHGMKMRRCARCPQS